MNGWKWKIPKVVYYVGFYEFYLHYEIISMSQYMVCNPTPSTSTSTAVCKGKSCFGMTRLWNEMIYCWIFIELKVFHFLLCFHSHIKVNGSPGLLLHNRTKFSTSKEYFSRRFKIQVNAMWRGAEKRNYIHFFAFFFLRHTKRNRNHSVYAVNIVYRLLFMNLYEISAFGLAVLSSRTCFTSTSEQP